MPCVLHAGSISGMPTCRVTTAGAAGSRLGVLQARWLQCLHVHAAFRRDLHAQAYHAPRADGAKVKAAAGLRLQGQSLHGAAHLHGSENYKRTGRELQARCKSGAPAAAKGCYTLWLQMLHLCEASWCNCCTLCGFMVQMLLQALRLLAANAASLRLLVANAASLRLLAANAASLRLLAANAATNS